MDPGGHPVRVAWVAGLMSLLLMVGAGPARAAFPGANGLLVVQPANGGGLLLVGEDGANPQQICSAGTRCAGARDPVWSPDGSEIALSARQSTSVIYPDGSCFACSLPEPFDYLGNSVPSFDAGFLPDGRLVVSTKSHSNYAPGPGLAAMKTDGVDVQWLKVSGSWRQPAWSPTGQLAAVRSVKRKAEVFVIDPITGSARQLTRGGASEPSWSPSGRRLAVVQDGWVDLIPSGGGRLKRLTRGGAPAWAPNGKELAFVGAHHRLFVIPVRGGTPRAVGHIRAVRVDWQPVTGNPQSSCQPPAGSSVLAATQDATITVDVSQPLGFSLALSVVGCLASDGHERLLESLPSSYDGGDPEVGSVAVAGDYAALVNEDRDLHYGGSLNALAAFDLRTGMEVAAGGVSADCPGSGGCSSGIDQLAVGIDGVIAAHTFVLQSPGPYPICTSVEQIVATDSTGTHTLDSITSTNPCDSPAPALLLSQLSLSGDTLTWSHAGTPDSAQLN
jgi:hypothetical protein